MGSTVQSMSTAMKGMEVDQIAKTMSEFERQFENMDVTSGTSATRKRCDSYPRSVLSLSNQTNSHRALIALLSSLKLRSLHGECDGVLDQHVHPSRASGLLDPGESLHRVI